MSAGDEVYIRRTLELARKAAGVTFPNPLVGAIVVSGGEIVGEGFHEGAGTPHAETIAIRRAADRAKGATLYLNLEPCCHFGRTPPCTDFIVGSRVSRVVFSIFDPDKRVRGRGTELLREHGIEVESGILAEEALELNLPYIHRCITGGPFIMLKLASTLDGRLTAGGRKQLTGEKARRRVHYLRAWTEAIAIGIGTLMADDPILDRRFYSVGLPPPLRMVFDTHLAFPASHRWLSEGEKVVLYCVDGTPREKINKLTAAGAEVVSLPAGDGGIDLSAWVNDVRRRGITAVIIEGGGRISTSVIAGKIFHRLVLFYAPLLSGSGGLEWFQRIESPEWIEEEELIPRRAELAGEDLMVVYDTRRILGYLKDVSQEDSICSRGS
jgi:diaminohydroxyphosphoribosylaminopyrimidine deaminase/5-amino-6-(5-phosphoribosylamino)uracil reductase